MRRRDFLALPAALALAPRSGVHLGIRSAVYRAHPMAEAAKRIRAAGLTHVHLGLAFSDGKFDMSAPDWDYAARARDVFGEAGLQIAGLDGYVNLVHPDPVRRRDGVRSLARLLENARKFGTPVVATETGSFHTERGRPDPDDSVAGWKEFIGVIRELLPAAEAGDSYLAVEPSYAQCFGNVEGVQRLLEEERSPHLKILWDAAHLIRVDELADTRPALERMRRIFGERVVLAHANDVFAGKEPGRVGSGRAGEGVLHYPTYLKLLASIRPDMTLCLEHVTEPQVPAAIEYVRSQDTAGMLAA